MAARKKQNQINLLPQEEFAASTTGRILKWALSTFRVIVVVVEMVVMGAFLSRFWLDARAADLNDEIAQNGALVESTLDFEKDFRKTQDRLTVFSGLVNQEPSGAAVLTLISQYIPNDVSLVSFSFGDIGINIKGISGSERGIAQFISNLENSDDFEKVILLQVDAQDENSSLLIFDLKLSVEKGGTN